MMSTWSRRLVPGVAVGVALVAWSTLAQAGYLLLSGATFRDPPFYGQIITPSGQSFDVERALGSLATQIVDDSDTLVYDEASGVFEIHPAVTPSELLASGAAFAGYDLRADVSLYSETALSFSCAPSAAEMDGAGALVHVGDAHRILCDTWFTSAATPPPDSDGDGIPDSTDNCPNVPNPDQADLDGDGLGDACDPDDDNDGLSDADEIGLYGTDPLLADTDGDGLGDGEEVTLYGTNPLLPDTDGDGFTDGQEVAAGTNPLDPQSYPGSGAPLPGLQGLAIVLLGLSLGGLGAWRLCHGRSRADAS